MVKILLEVVNSKKFHDDYGHCIYVGKDGDSELRSIMKNIRNQHGQALPDFREKFPILEPRSVFGTTFDVADIRHIIKRLRLSIMHFQHEGHKMNAGLWQTLFSPEIVAGKLNQSGIRKSPQQLANPQDKMNVLLAVEFIKAVKIVVDNRVQILETWKNSKCSRYELMRHCLDKMVEISLASILIIEHLFDKSLDLTGLSF